MRVLITGATGLLGWWVVREAVRLGHDTVGAYHSRPPARVLEGVSWVKLDVTDSEAVAEALERLRPDIVVHSAAYTDVDGCEADMRRAYRTNYLGTLAVARGCSRVGCSVIYVSTDYVFDGEKGMYSEGDTPRPINYYGLTKLLGEAATAGSSSENVIVRVSGLYGWSPTGKRNFGVSALERLMSGAEVRAFYDQFLSPTYVPFLARALLRIPGTGVRGIIHVAGERVSRYEFAVAIARKLGVDVGLVKPVPMGSVKLLARRPRDSSLDTSRARSVGLAHPPLEESVEAFIRDYIKLRNMIS